MDTFYAYHVAACSDGWQHLDFVNNKMQVTNHAALWENVLKAARKVEWNDTFAIEPHVFYLPDVERFKTGFAWTQKNDNDLIVISPIALSWLKTLALDQSEDHYGEYTEFELDD